MVEIIDAIEFVGFEWNEGNKEKNRIKHHVETKESEEVFFDKPLYLEDKKQSVTEKRLYVFGETKRQRLLTVIFTFRSKKVRIISAKDTSNKEKRFYKENIKSYLTVKKHEKTKKA